MTEGASITSHSSRILTINGGSSSIKFGFIEVRAPVRRLLHGEIDQIGQKQASLQVDGLVPADHITRCVKAPDHAAAVVALMNYIGECGARRAVAAVGHRVVHGGPKCWAPSALPPT